MSDPAPLAFTGERFTPECVREIWYEHWHRYAFVREFARGKRVLDAACGEGYGSALLAMEAASVLGVDIAQDTIEHAKARYAGHANLRFLRGDCTALELPASAFDLVVSFETLEHVAAQAALIAGFARVLADDGVLVVSSPDKRTYSEVNGFRNEFHVRELYREELLNLVKPHFPFVHVYGQKLLFQSAIWSLEPSPKSVATATSAAGVVRSGLDYDPLYYLVVCSRQPLTAPFPDLALFGDREESVYRHYNGEVRKNMAAGGRIATLEAEIAALRRQLDRIDRGSTAQPWWRRWLAALRGDLSGK